MSDIAIQVENLSKAYQLGKIGTGTISRDLERFFVTKILGKEDPFLKVGQTNDRTVKGTSDIVWSLKDIDFTINQGDAVGIIGKNGAGKSTLLKILSRVTSPTTGNIKIKGRVASLLEVGTGFHPELSGRENIYLNGAILGMRKAEIKRKFDEIVDFAGVERYIDTPVKRYSSGMYVRLAFAVAAHLESEILIVDEVLAVGDAEFKKKCLGKMGDISKGEGRTILFVSHDMNAITTLTKRSLFLQNGEIVLDDSTNKVVERYLYDYKNYNSKSNLEVLIFDKYLIDDISLLNLNDKKVDLIEFGGDFKFRLDMKKISDEEDFYVEFKLKNSKGVILTVFSTYLYGFKINSKNQIILECFVNNINLVLGYYYVDVLFISKLTEKVMYFENILTFEVISGTNYFLKKQLKSQHHGYVVLNHHWVQNEG